MNVLKIADPNQLPSLSIQMNINLGDFSEENGASHENFDSYHFLKEQHPESYPNYQSQDLRGSTIAMIITVSIICALSIRIWYRSAIWKKGRIPRFFGYRNSSVVSILINLGYNFILLERESIPEKRKFMQSYFKKNYPGANYDITHSMKNAKVYPLKNQFVGEWFQRKLKDESARSNILYFVMGICWADGRMNSRERKHVLAFCKSLGLTDKYFFEIMAIYEARFFREEEERRERTQHSSQKRRQSQRKIYFNVLGIKETNDIKIVKKAYRKLAKIHHPDMLSTKTQIEQSIAEQKFLEIKNAYENLEELLK